MYVILDLHGGPGGINGFINSGQAVVNNYWTDATAQQRTINLWKAIANRYKTNPAVAAYDLLNEPLSSNQALYPIHQFGISGAKMGQTSTIHGVFAGNDVAIAPNPASGSINLKTGLNNYHIEIYNTNGTLVTTKDNVNDTDSISTKQLQAGTYVIKITGQGKSTSKKLIIN